jgi:hypothetical protein
LFLCRLFSSSSLVPIVADFFNNSMLFEFKGMEDQKNFLPRELE